MITNRRLECHKERQLSFRLEALTRKKQKRHAQKKYSLEEDKKRIKEKRRSRRLMFDFAKAF